MISPPLDRPMDPSRGSPPRERARELARLAVNRLSADRCAELRDLGFDSGDPPARSIPPWLTEAQGLAEHAMAIAKALEFSSPESSAVPCDRPTEFQGASPPTSVLWVLSLFRELRGDAPDDLYHYSLADGLRRAIAAHVISETWHEGVDAVRAAMVGLVESVGILVFAQELGRPYTDLLHHVRSNGIDLRVAESQILGFDHGAVSLAVCHELAIRGRLAPEGGDRGEAVDVTRTPFAVPGTEGERIDANDERGLIPRLDTPNSRILEVIAQANELLNGPRGTLENFPSSGFVSAERRNVDHAPPANDCRNRSPSEIEGMRARITRRFEELSRVLAIPAMPAIAVVAKRDDTAQPTLEAERSPWMREHATGTPHDATPQKQARGPIPRPPQSTVKTADGLRHAKRGVTERGVTVGDSTSRVSTTELMTVIARAGTNCRQRRRPLSLVLIAPDDAAPIGVDTETTWNAVLAGLRSIVAESCGCRAVEMRLVDGTLAVLIEDCDRGGALRLARAMHDRIQSLARRGLDPRVHGPSCSLGVATLAMPPRNFVPEDLVTASRRCLNAAALAGGGLIKSVDLL